MNNVQGDLARTLADVCARVLGDMEVSPDDIFVAIGGESITAVVCVNRFRRLTGFELDISWLLGNGTLRECVAQLSGPSAHRTSESSSASNG
jgi:phosphopantetheine binding protein